MPNFQVFDAYGSVITIASSTVGSAERQIVQVSVMGALPVTIPGTNMTSIVSTVPSSVIVGASIFGQLPAGTAPIGSIATLQGTNPWIITGSIQGNVSGSVASYPLGTIVTSLVSTVPSSVIVGASVFGQLPGGTAVLGSVATLQGTNPWNIIGSVATSNPQSSVISMSAPFASVIQGTADLRVVQGGSVVVIAGPGDGIRNYINHVQVVNFGSASVLVTIADNTTSILGYTIAPAGGGSNYDCLYKAALNSPVTASINGTASVLVSAQGFTA